nr:hypothetical protein [Mesorhizobium sp.]
MRLGLISHRDGAYTFDQGNPLPECVRCASVRVDNDEFETGACFAGIGNDGADLDPILRM